MLVLPSLTAVAPRQNRINKSKGPWDTLPSCFSAPATSWVTTLARTAMAPQVSHLSVQTHYTTVSLPLTRTYEPTCTRTSWSRLWMQSVSLIVTKLTLRQGLFLKQPASDSVPERTFCSKLQFITTFLHSKIFHGMLVCLYMFVIESERTWLVFTSSRSYLWLFSMTGLSSLDGTHSNTHTNTCSLHPYLRKPSGLRTRIALMILWMCTYTHRSSHVQYIRSS